MSRVLLVSANRESAPDYVPPIALAHLAGALRAAGHEPAVSDLLLADDPLAAIDAALADHAPDVVGLSVRNIDDAAFPATKSLVPGLVPLARRLVEFGRPVVLGGSGASIAPRALLDRLGIDVAVVGEGERVLPDLVAALAAGGPAPPLPGVVVRDGAGFRATAPEPVHDLGRLPPPEYGVLDLAAYRRLGGALGIQTKRGCPLTCSYCVYPGNEGAAIRSRGAAAVAEEIARLHDTHGIERFFFVDSVFNQPPSHALEVACAVGALSRRVRYSCYLAPRGVSPELAEALVASGCEGVEFGTDSLAEPVLARLGKAFSFEDVAAAAAACRAAGLPQCHHFIFGTPGETPATVRTTLERAEAIGADAAIGMTGVRVYPGTRLARSLFPDDGAAPDLLDPFHYVAPEVAESLSETILRHARRHRGWILPGLAHNCGDGLFRGLRQGRYRGPAWKLVRALGE